jgi:fructokinase
MRSLITCLGEILIDFLPIEEDARTVGFKMHPGGSPFNVAVGLARLEQHVSFACKISSDLFGRYLRDYAESESIDTRFLLPSEAQSTLAFVAMEGGEPAYAFYGEGTADALLTVEELPPALFEETAILAFGSISLLRGTTPAAVVATARRLKGKALLAFDPNIRPGLVYDEAAYRDLLNRLFALADIVKISAVDLAWLAPAQPPEKAAADILACGPALVVVTQGSSGVLALRGRDRIEIPAFKLKVVDTVGAGDAFSAGMLAALMERRVVSRPTLDLMEGHELAASLRFAAATSGITCMRPGADPPTRAEVAAFLDSQSGA